MTKNQIEYNKLREQRRANLQQEELTRIRDTASIELGRSQLGEQTRHNLAGEQLQTASLDETRRSNLAKEGETIRSNLAREEENRRHNVASEELTSTQLAEVARHNRASEGLQSRTISLGYAQLGETTRHNQQLEALTASQQTEIQRHNVAQEALQRTQIGETRRHQIAQDILSALRTASENRYRSQSIGLESRKVGIQEQDAATRSQTLEETKRHNKQTESQGWLRTGAEAFKDVQVGIGKAVESAKTTINLLGGLS